MSTRAPSSKIILMLQPLRGPSYRNPTAQEVVEGLGPSINQAVNTLRAEFPIYNISDGDQVNFENFFEFFSTLHKETKSGIMFTPDAQNLRRIQPRDLVQQTLIILDIDRLLYQNALVPNVLICPLLYDARRLNGTASKLPSVRSIVQEVDAYFGRTVLDNLIYAIGPRAYQYKKTDEGQPVEFDKAINFADFCNAKKQGSLQEYDSSMFDPYTGCRYTGTRDIVGSPTALRYAVTDWVSNYVAAELKTNTGIGVLDIDLDDVDNACFNGSYIFLRSVYNNEYHQLWQRSTLSYKDRPDVAR